MSEELADMIQDAAVPYVMIQTEERNVKVLSNMMVNIANYVDFDPAELGIVERVYYPVLDIALELSSMGIRVDRDALLYQLQKSGCEDRMNLPFQQAILNEELPYTIGGGIGQSRICMFFLRKAHIGEVQSSLWPEEMVALCEEHGVQLL